MSHTRLWVAATIIAGVILASFVLSVPHTRDIIDTSTPDITIMENVPSVALRDVFKKGMHTITGSIEAPSSCTSISARATLASTTEGAASILVEIFMPKDSGVCLERASMLKFSTTLEAPVGLPLTASVNGIAATTTDL